MPITRECAIGTRFMCGNYVVELAEAADVIFLEARSVDAVAEMLQASERVTPDARDNMALNASNLANQIVSDGTQGFPVGQALDVTYGPTGRILTDRGVPPVLNLVATTVEDVADTIIVVTFDQDVNSALNDYDLGFSCKVNDVARAINAGARQADNKVIHLTLAAAVAPGDAVLLSYDKEVGDLKSDTGAEVQSFVDSVVDNNVV
jgi:hypothetical protein